MKGKVAQASSAAVIDTIDSSLKETSNGITNGINSSFDLHGAFPSF